MKLPQHIEGIHREGRTDSFNSTGVGASFLRGLLGKIPGVGGVAKKAACWACKKACDATVC